MKDDLSPDQVAEIKAMAEASLPAGEEPDWMVSHKTALKVAVRAMEKTVSLQAVSW